MVSLPSVRNKHSRILIRSGDLSIYEVELGDIVVYEYFKAIPHNPCASVCAASTGVEAQIFVRSPKFDAGLQAKFTSLYATSRRIDVIFDDVGNHEG